VGALLCDNRLGLVARVLAGSPDLRVVSLIGAGYANVDIMAARAAGVVVTNTPAVMATSVAELTIGLMVAAGRGIVDLAQQVRSGGWTAIEQQHLGLQFAGRKLGIIGLGATGRAVAGLAAGLGMDVAYCDPASSDPRFRKLALPELLARSDVLCVHADLNASSRGLIGAAQLRLMPRGAILINMARGALIDEHALCQSLRSGHLRAAALDVLSVEPPGADMTDLLQTPGLIVVPHIGAATGAAREAMFDLAASNLLDALAGNPVRDLASAVGSPR
jgi:phosphoglycerate dehydrogenase-like enzyme